MKVNVNLDVHDNVIVCVIASLFAAAKKFLDDPNSRVDFDNKRKFLLAAELVFQAFGAKPEDDDMGAIEELVNLAIRTSKKSHFKEFIDIFCAFMDVKEIVLAFEPISAEFFFARKFHQQYLIHAILFSYPEDLIKITGLDSVVWDDRIKDKVIYYE